MICIRCRKVETPKPVCTTCSAELSAMHYALEYEVLGRVVYFPDPNDLYYMREAGYRVTKPRGK